MFISTGDSGTVVVQTSAVLAYTSAGYAYLGHADTNANLASDTVTSATGSIGDGTADVSTESRDVVTSVAANTVAHNQSLCHENEDNTDQNPAKEEVPNTTTNDSSEDFASFVNVSMNISQVTAYNYSLNGNDAGEAKNIVSAGINENGITKDVHLSVSEHLVANVLLSILLLKIIFVALLVPNVLWRVSSMVLASKLQIFSSRI